MIHLEKKSPSGKKIVKLSFDRELHFGPIVFTVKISGFTVEGGLNSITEDVCWSLNDRYLAVVEIIQGAENKKNMSNLNLIDTDTGVIKLVSSKAGLITALSVSDDGDIKYK